MLKICQPDAAWQCAGLHETGIRPEVYFADGPQGLWSTPLALCTAHMRSASLLSLRRICSD